MRTGGGLFQRERFMVGVRILLTDLLTADLDNPGYSLNEAAVRDPCERACPTMDRPGRPESFTAGSGFGACREDGLEWPPAVR